MVANPFKSFLPLSTQELFVIEVKCVLWFHPSVFLLVRKSVIHINLLQGQDFWKASVNQEISLGRFKMRSNYFCKRFYFCCLSLTSIKYKCNIYFTVCFYHSVFILLCLAQNIFMAILFNVLANYFFLQFLFHFHTTQKFIQICHQFVNKHELVMFSLEFKLLSPISLI